MPDALTSSRHEAADREFESYDFGDARLGEVDGWEFTQPGSEYVRTIWFENDEPGGPDLKGHFAVRFASDASDEIVEAYASLNGNDVGRRRGPGAAPR